MKLTKLPELNFVTADIDKIDLEVVTRVENILGRKLERADPLRLFLRGIEAIIQQQRLLIDEYAKQNLLAYATGGHLDHLGALVGVERLKPAHATTTMLLKLSAPRAQATIIKQGTRFTAGNNVFFALDTAVIFLGDEIEQTARATCTETGTLGNNYLPGEIHIISDPQPFLESAVNTTISEGGAELETDDAFRERIHEAPESFSVAGPEEAYRWFAMSANPSIADVHVYSYEPGCVSIYPLLKGGELPGDEILEAVKSAVNARHVRPLTDKVEVQAPFEVFYRINVGYYIAQSQATSQAIIVARAEEALREYILWQRSEMGRDINPTELIHRLQAAGVKRVVLHEPEYQPIFPFEIALVEESPTGQMCSMQFLGLEQD